MFQKDEWEFFTGTTVASSEASVQLPRWATPDRREIFAMYANTFGMMLNSLHIDNEGLWGGFAQSDQAEVEFPDQIANKISPFQKLILIQVFRPDRLESAMQQFVKEAFGGQVIQPTPFSLPRLYESESRSNEPILFIISPGSDPSEEL
jgi:dynein heavy chain 2